MREQTDMTRRMHNLRLHRAAYDKIDALRRRALVPTWSLSHSLIETKAKTAAQS
jgi:hypothetical protein